MRKKYEVSFRPKAETDLFELYHYIARQSGRAVAGAYIDRIESACIALESFPERGKRRDDIRPGLRIVGFERRAVIVFQVKANEVVIIPILYGGREYERVLHGSNDD